MVVLTMYNLYELHCEVSKKIALREKFHKGMVYSKLDDHQHMRQYKLSDQLLEKISNISALFVRLFEGSVRPSYS